MMRSPSHILLRVLKKIRKEPLEYFVALVCVIGNGAWPAVEHTSIYTAFLILVLGLYVILRIKKLKVGEWILPVLLLITLPVLSLVFKLSSNSNVVNLLATTTLLSILSLFNIADLLKILGKYAEIIVGFIVISVIMKIMLFIFPSIYHIALKENTSFAYYYNFFIYTERVGSPIRSQSIFWEPGVWGINQMFALAWYVLYKKNIKLYWLFFISIVMTMSTTGLALFTILSIYIFFFSDFKIDKFKVVIITLGSVLLIVLSTLFFLNQYSTEIDDFIYMQTIGKIAQKNGSLENRMQATEATWKITKSNPIFGVGRSTTVYVTSAILEILYQTGFPFFLIYFITFCRVFKGMSIFLAILFVLIMMNGEALAFLNLYSMIVILGSKLLFCSSAEKIEQSKKVNQYKLIRIIQNG